jgi:hypothetical protein
MYVQYTHSLFFCKPFKEPVIEPGEIDSLELITGLLKPLQIRAQRYKLDHFFNHAPTGTPTVYCMFVVQYSMCIVQLYFLGINEESINL